MKLPYEVQPVFRGELLVAGVTASLPMKIGVLPMFQPLTFRCYVSLPEVSFFPSTIFEGDLHIIFLRGRMLVTCSPGNVMFQVLRTGLCKLGLQVLHIDRQYLLAWISF